MPVRTRTAAGPPAPDAPVNGSRHLRDRRWLGARVAVVVVVAAVGTSLLLAVPGLRRVAGEVRHLDLRWLLGAVVLELASCLSFVVIFRLFFPRLAGSTARRLAWTEMGSGALLPGGGVGSLAVGGWLLHQAGMSTREILRNSSGLFFLTSAVNVVALIGGGALLASGVSGGQNDFILAGPPILGGLLVIVVLLMLDRTVARAPRALGRWASAAQLVSGIGEARRAVRHPSRRLFGAVGYLGFDVAVLWATLRSVGYDAPIPVLILGYVIGYLANVIPIPGAFGVLEGGLVGALVLYGAPLTEATAGVLVYHAIAFWLPSGGGLLAYRSLRAHEIGYVTAPPVHRAAMELPAMQSAADGAANSPSTSQSYKEHLPLTEETA